MMPQDESPELSGLSPVAEVAVFYEADILVINSGMDAGLSDKVRNLISELDETSKNVVLVLITSGGLADEAYRCGRLLQQTYNKITVCIFGWCKSAGTLLALAGNMIVMGPKGELGPLDVQLMKRDELFDRDSGLISNAALDRLREEAFQTFEEVMLKIIARSNNAITFRTAAEVAAEITVGVMSPVFDKIDPMRLGTDARAMDIGAAYATRLNIHGGNLRGNEALNMLLNGYPSHSFVIDLMEAQNLFNNVQPLCDKMIGLAEALGAIGVIPLDDPLVCFLNDTDENEENDDDASGKETGPRSEKRAETANDKPGDEGTAA